MNKTIERELKLEADTSVSIEDLGGEPLDSRTFTSTYYDTEGGLLLRLGIVLRRRMENGKNDWQLKLPREDSRVELEAAGGPAGPPPRARRDPAGNAGRPAAATGCDAEDTAEWPARRWC